MGARYIQPVMLADEVDAARKRRHVEIYKSEVYKDIDLHTHKHVDAREDMGLRSGNAVSSDIAEAVDSAVITRYVEFRDARLRVRLQSLLADTEKEEATDLLPHEDNRYHYWFNVPETFNDNVLRPLAEYIHRFLVFGALYDWYNQFAGYQNIAAGYKTQADEAEDKVVSIMRGPAIVKKPLQPFGPAEKIYP